MKQKNIKMNKVMSSATGGFTLFELSIVLLILSTMLGGFLTVLSSNKEENAILYTRNQLVVIEDAILKFYARNKYIPCVAANNATEGSSTFGVSTDCSAGTAPSGTSETGSGTNKIRTGVLPTRTLALPDRYMYDGWGNRFNYTSVKDLAIDQATFDAYTTALTTGVIRVNDEAGNQVTIANVLSIVTHVIVSSGKDRNGAYSNSGALTSACNIAYALDYENCDGDNIFISGSLNDSVTATKYYYDIVSWKMKHNLAIYGYDN